MTSRQNYEITMAIKFAKRNIDSPLKCLSRFANCGMIKYFDMASPENINPQYVQKVMERFER